MGKAIIRGLGWHRSIPDFRDYSWDNAAVSRMLKQLKPAPTSQLREPERVDLREYFPDVCDQQEIHASTAVEAWISCWSQTSGKYSRRSTRSGSRNWDVGAGFSCFSIRLTAALSQE